jgi:hypothetical protein
MNDPLLFTFYQEDLSMNNDRDALRRKHFADPTVQPPEVESTDSKPKAKKKAKKKAAKKKAS